MLQTDDILASSPDEESPAGVPVINLDDKATGTFTIKTGWQRRAAVKGGAANLNDTVAYDGYVYQVISIRRAKNVDEVMLWRDRKQTVEDKLDAIGGNDG